MLLKTIKKRIQHDLSKNLNVPIVECWALVDAMDGIKQNEGFDFIVFSDSLISALLREGGIGYFFSIFCIFISFYIRY